MNRRGWNSFAFVFACLFFLTACVTELPAATVLSDNFNRSGALSGSSPTISSGQTWTATSAFTLDGSKVVAEGSFLQAAYLPLPTAIQSGFVYTLSATTFFNVASSDNSAFMQIGFFDSTPSWDGSTVYDGGHTIGIGPRNNISSVADGRDGVTHPSDIFSPDGTNGVTFGIRLYETVPNSWVADMIEVAPTIRVLSSSPTPVSITPISTVGLISAASHPPFIDNFTLDVSPAPEPGTLGLVLSSAVILLGSRRRPQRSPLTTAASRHRSP